MAICLAYTTSDRIIKSLLVLVQTPRFLQTITRKREQITQIVPGFRVRCDLYGDRMCLKLEAVCVGYYIYHVPYALHCRIYRLLS